MATEDKDGFNIGMLAPLAGPIGYGLGQIFGPSRDTLRREQLEDQQKLIDQQGAANRQQAQFTSDLQYDMWNKTNYGAQVGHLNAAGLNPALLYGKGGGGGATTGSAAAAGVSGGTAATAAATEANQLQKTMMMTQMGLTAAQTAKTNAETKNIEAGTEKTGVDTATGKLNLDTATKTQDSAIQKIREDSYKAVSEAAIAAQNQSISQETMKDQIRQITETTINKILQNEGQSIENRKKTAEATIEEFEARMAKDGISPRTPWWMKLVADQLDKIGLNPLVEKK